MPDIGLHQALRSYFIRGAILENEIYGRIEHLWTEYHKLLGELVKRKNTKRLATRCIQQPSVTQVTEAPGVGPVAKQVILEEQSGIQASEGDKVITKDLLIPLMTEEVAGSSKPTDVMAGIEVIGLDSESALTHRPCK
ncbi:uncharacterized protein A4U43_C08F15270 [Asparagus officinalis]|nr:uncharacterized protein A4U43_C08F15270 [Asparagus officinalis]